MWLLLSLNNLKSRAIVPPDEESLWFVHGFVKLKRKLSNGVLHPAVEMVFVIVRA